MVFSYVGRGLNTPLSDFSDSEIHAKYTGIVRATQRDRMQIDRCSRRVCAVYRRGMRAADRRTQSKSRRGGIHDVAILSSFFVRLGRVQRTREGFAPRPRPRG